MTVKGLAAGVALGILVTLATLGILDEVYPLPPCSMGMAVPGVPLR